MLSRLPALLLKCRCSSRVNSAAKAVTRYSEGVELPAILITPGSADGSGPNLDMRASKSEIVLIANCMDSRPTSVRIAPVPRRSNKRVPNSRSEMLDLTTKPRLAHTQSVCSPRKAASFNNAFYVSSSLIFTSNTPPHPYKST